MTELSNTPPSPENDPATSKASSPWVMLISMLLLIAVLILSSVMLVHYAMGGKEGETGKSTFSFANLIEKGKALSTQSEPGAEQQPENQSETTDFKPAEPGMKRFFSGEGSVRWPRLKLTGFGKGSGGQSGFAIINGEQVLVNTPINGAMLVEILDQGVVMEYKGEQKTLTVKLN